MQLHRLEVEGFGPFRARQSVDFDAFADDGIFLIAGRTGAGKSSILDAVCFGLYGGVPRYDGGDKRLRSDHCEPDDITEVVVEFSTPAGRYRVRRSPEYERPKRRGGGMTTQASAVQLDTMVAGEWVGLAAKEREAAYELDEILQLSREQFLQVILLAQNRFSEFLLAGSRDRQALLRRLFGTERFEDVQARFEERRRAAEEELRAGLAAVSARLDEAERLVVALAAPVPEQEAALSIEPQDAPRTTEERLKDLDRARARADYRAERLAAEKVEAEERSSQADAALAAAKEEQRDQQERDRARLALATLDAEEPAIAAAREELAQARLAESLRATIASASRASAATVAARDAEAEARRSWESLDVDTDDLDEWIAERTRESGVWRRAEELERALPAVEAELAGAGDAVSAATTRLATIDAERDGLPARQDQLSREVDDERLTAGRVEARATEAAAATARLAAAVEVAGLESAERSAERALVEMSATLTSRQSELTALRKRRLEGFAGELASELQDGAACPVCGAHEHPAPAVHADPVSAEDVAEAEARRDAAAAEERDASERLGAVRSDLIAARTRADGRDVDAATSEQERSAREYELAAAAVERVRVLESSLDDLQARANVLQTERDSATAALAEVREAQGLLAQRATEARAVVAEARGTHSSVAERLARSDGEVAAARTLLDASAELVRRLDAATAADAELAAALDDSPFPDAAAADHALRSPAAQEALDGRIAQHAVQREKERAILLPLELRTLPEEPIDLGPAETRSAEARARWTEAVTAAERAAGAAERLSGLLADARSAYERSAEGAADFDVLRGLADAIAGRGANTRKMTLETFVLAAELEEIVDAANRRLSDMSTGRYQLRHSDALAARGAASGLGIVVFDAYTGQTRPAQSLSGGETFLSSLALALGLAEVVTARAGGIRLDTLFIDEGFGSLDGDTLDVAMRTLDELRQGGRTVGVISHVEAMQEQIPAQLAVRATPQGPSVIETR
ncbi:MULTISPECIES: SMC family ATPase [unclassified Microbacterium]|uniref:SMC family ATPase n=1 Tax=unclassified Microbacterium TaxID=2609290 RepID=UPI00343CD328